MSTGSAAAKKLSVEERLSLAARGKTRKKGKRLDSPSPAAPVLESEAGNENLSPAEAQDALATSNQTPKQSGELQRSQLDSGFLQELAEILPTHYHELSVEDLLIALRPHLKMSESRTKDTSLAKLIKEKDSIIADLRKEGENLSKLELRHNNTIKGLRDKLKASEYDIERSREDTERRKSEYNSLSQELEFMETAHKEANEKLAEALKERDEIRARNDALERGQLSELQEQVSVDQKTIKSLESQLQRARDQLETMTLKADMKYRGLEETSQGEIGRLETILEETRIKLSHFSTKPEQLADSRQLAEKHEQLEKEFENSRQNWYKLEASLRQELYDAENSLRESTKSNTHTNESLNAAHEEIASLKSKIEALRTNEDALNKDLKKLHVEIEELRNLLTNAQDEVKLWQEKYRIRKSELDTVLQNPGARDDLRVKSETDHPDREVTPTNLEDLDKVSNWELQNLQTLDISCNENNGSVSIKSQYDLDELLPNEELDLSNSLRKSSMTSLDYTPSRQLNNTAQDQQVTQLNAQMIGRLGSQIRRLETELASLQESHEKLVKEKQTVNDTIFRLMEENERFAEVKNQLEESSEHGAELENRLNETTRLLAERTERVEELENDVDDLKELMQMQVQQLVELQELVR
ncbi:LAFA_0F10528g1_1 [Lachancea sp. 'fantastica']|nr:LAFA_0F10528g1_1 [Lachancea sp. 'fantastica']